MAFSTQVCHFGNYGANHKKVIERLKKSTLALANTLELNSISQNYAPKIAKLYAKLGVSLASCMGKVRKAMQSLLLHWNEERITLCEALKMQLSYSNVSRVVELRTCLLRCDCM